jgi:flagellar biosynthesis protein FlhG
MTKDRADQAAGLRKINPGQEETQGEVRVIAVTSGKGGVGKTNIVANLAIALARLGQRVMVMDADLSLANLDILLGLSPEYHLGHVLGGHRKLEEIIVSGPAGIKILPAASGVQELSLLSDWQKMALLEEVDTLADQVDVLFIDTSAGIGANVIYFNLAAQERLVIVTPEPTSITDAYALIKVLFAQHQEKSFRILVNESRSEKEAKEVFVKLANVADRFLAGVSLDYLGHIPHDQNILKAVRRQEAFVEVFPESPASKSIFKIANSLLSEQPSRSLEGNIRFFWKRLFALQSRLE